MALWPSTAALAAPAPSAGSFGAVRPFRLLDTRLAYGGSGPVASQAMVSVPVTGRGNVPASNVAAVMLNVTATDPTAAGFVTVWADQTPRPLSSNLNFVPAQTVPNLVVAPVGPDGSVALFNGSLTGSVDLIVDVSGYYVGTATSQPAAPGAYHAVDPARLVDTRLPVPAPVPSGGTVAVGITGGHEVPGGAGAVVLNVTVADPSAAGYLSAYPDGSDPPDSSNVNFIAGQTVPNLVIVPIGPDGHVRIFNGSSGTVQVIVDVFGYFGVGAPTGQGDFGVVAPSRLLDTRGAGPATNAPIPANSSLVVPVAGGGGVPTHGVEAVIVNVTATQPGAAGYLTVWAGDTAPPTASNVNFVAGGTSPNLVSSPVRSSGSITIYNGSSAAVDVVVDVFGYTLAADLPVPAPSQARYVRDISGAAGDVTTMYGQGCADSGVDVSAATRLSVLFLGAQTNNVALSSPGVLLTGGGSVRLTYAQVVAALEGYLAGFSSCNGSNGPASVAIATNSDGDFAGYTAQAKGTDWATEVIAPLQAYASAQLTGITVVGANDIEAGFAATAQQATDWVTSYLAVSAAQGALIYVGSADGCPTAFGSIDGACAAIATDGPQVANTWTQAQYHELAFGLGPSRIQVLPQVYVDSQAQQWANIARSGSAGMTVLGSLTQHAVQCGVPCAMTATQGWAVLWQALSGAVSTTPASLPLAVDLRVDA